MALIGLWCAGTLFSCPVVAAPIAIAEVKHEGDVDFEKEILPIFRRNCLACHSATEAQSDLVLESPQTILKGRQRRAGGRRRQERREPAAHAGQQAKRAAHAAAGQRREGQAAHAAGAGPDQAVDRPGGQGRGQRRPIREIAWQPLPPGINPIYAVAITPDGQYAAASRANQIFLYHVPSKRELGRLTDPALLERGIYKQPGVADLDLVQSLKFSPDGTLLASGGFRTVKLWRKPAVGEAGSRGAGRSASAAMHVRADGNRSRPGDEDGKVEVSKRPVAKNVKTLDHGSPVAAVAASADGKRLASVGRPDAAKLWNVEAESQVAELKGDIPRHAQGRRAHAAARAGQEAHRAGQEGPGRRQHPQEGRGRESEKIGRSADQGRRRVQAQGRSAKKAAEEKRPPKRLLADATAAKTKAEEAKKAAEEASPRPTRH